MNNVVEVQFSVEELCSVVKSLGIGTDQLAKKLSRYPKGGGKHFIELCDEYESLTNALGECQSVLTAVLRSNNE